MFLQQLYRAVLALRTARELDAVCVFEGPEQWRRWDDERGAPGERKGKDCNDPDIHVGHVAPSFHDPRTGMYDGRVMRIIVGLRSSDTSYCKRWGNTGLCGRGYAQDFDCEAVRDGGDWQVICKGGRSRMYYH